ncbi:bifunctional fucokinase/fucose pyrophosphorylase [Tanacetum coccineum]
MQDSNIKHLMESCGKNVDYNSVVVDVSDCLKNEGIKIVTTIEKNDVKDTGNGISVVNKVDKMEQKREIGNGVIDISIGLMGVRVMDCDDKDVVGSEEIGLGASEIDDDNKCAGVLDRSCGETSDEKRGGKHDETRDGKSDEFVHNDGKKEDLKSLDENGKEEDCNIEEIESNGVTKITGGWIGVGELCKEDGKGKRIESSGVITNSFGLKVFGEICKEEVEVKGIQSKNSKENDGNKKCLQNHNDNVKGGKLMDNGQVMCRNRGMSKLAWKPLVKMRMNGSIMGENIGDADYVVIRINESVISESISEVELVFEGITRSIGDLDGKCLFMACKDANKNGVNSCYWELSGCKWRGRKKTYGIYCQVRNNKWKFDIWRWPRRKKKVGGILSKCLGDGSIGVVSRFKDPILFKFKRNKKVIRCLGKKDLEELEIFTRAELMIVDKKLLKVQVANGCSDGSSTENEVSTSMINFLKKKHILLLHAGGDSKRVPWANPMGKVFLPLPYLAADDPDGPVPLLFDHILAISSCARQAYNNQGGLFIMTGDVLPCFDASAMVLPEDTSCIITVPITLDIASNHGVIVSSKTDNSDEVCSVSPVANLLQKPSVEELSKHHAILDDGRALLDTGIIAVRGKAWEDLVTLSCLSQPMISELLNTKKEARIELLIAGHLN